MTALQSYGWISPERQVARDQLTSSVVPAPKPVNKTYEELTGAEDRGIYFRAERLHAREVLGKPAPLARINQHALELGDFSMGGLSVLARPDDDGPGEIGEELPLEIGVGRLVLYRGRAQIRRIEPNPFRTKVALAFTSGYLDVPSFVGQCRKIQLRHELDQLHAPRLSPIKPEYRLHCADTLHFLQRLRAISDDFAARCGGSPETAVEDFLALCDELVVPEWRRLWHRGNEIVRAIMPRREALAFAKDFTERMLTPAFMPGPIWRRSFEKPRGYPGDFELMRQVYAWETAGESLYAKAMHRIGLDVAECIATRMHMAQETIAQRVRNKPGDEPVSLMSLGCGPAEEIARYLDGASGPGALNVTLVDQDHDALATAHGRCYPLLTRRADGSAIRPFEVSFAALLRDNKVFSQLGAQDLIYSMGLIDYLTPRRAHQLVSALYETLAPGGQLLIGNMADVAGGNQWPMEFICDWSVRYRTEADMRAMARGLPAAQLDVVSDPTERVVILKLVKP